MAGMNPIAFVRERDQLQRVLMQSIADRVNELRGIRDHNLAVMIAEEVGKLFK